MKNMRMYLLRTIFVILPVTLLTILPLISQSIDDLKREIIVYLQPDIFGFPVSGRAAVLPENTVIRSNELNQAFARFNVERIVRAFPDFDEADSVRSREDGAIVKVPNFHRIFVLTIGSSADIDAAIAAFSSIPGVVYAESNWDGDARLEYDPTYNLQWHLNNTTQNSGTPGADISAEAAWQIFTGSSSIKIGIFDTGVDLNHEEFSGKISGDHINIGSDPYWSHGTHVAGIAAARANNGKGGRGVDWNAQIDSRRVMDGWGVHLGNSNAANKITGAVNAGVHVLNHSWSQQQASNTIAKAIAYAYKLNRINVAAMGNGYGELIRFPAAYGQGVIAVGATQDDDSHAPYSNRGNHISVSAPGGTNIDWNNKDERDIWSTFAGGNKYDYAAGTSMATPIVSGIASLLKGYAQDVLQFNIYNQ